MTPTLTIIMAAYNAGKTSFVETPYHDVLKGEGNVGAPEAGELAVAELVEAEAEGSDLATAGCLRGQKSQKEIHK